MRQIALAVILLTILLIPPQAAAFTFGPFLPQAPIIPQFPITPDDERRFGFGFVNIGWMRSRFWTADNFFNGMFLTPPYPSTVQFVMGAGINQFGNNGHNNFLLRVMERASEYPNIKITLIAGWRDFDNPVERRAYVDFVDLIGDSPWAFTVAALGLDQEHVRTEGGPVKPNASRRAEIMDWMQALSLAKGFRFVSYFPQSFNAEDLTSDGRRGTAEFEAIMARWEWQMHTNWPSGDHLRALRDGGVGKSTFVGQSVGLDGGMIFPSPGCEAPFDSATPGYSIVRFEEGHMPSAEDQELYWDPVQRWAGKDSKLKPTFLPCHNVLNGEDGFDPSIKEIMRAWSVRPIQNGLFMHMVTGASRWGHSDQALERPFSGDLSAGMTSIWTDETTLLFWNTQFRGQMWDWILNNPNDFLLGTDPATTPPPPPPPPDGNGDLPDPDPPDMPPPDQSPGVINFIISKIQAGLQVVVNQIQGFIDAITGFFGGFFGG